MNLSKLSLPSRILISIFLTTILVFASIALQWPSFQSQWVFESQQNAISNAVCGRIKAGQLPTPDMNCSDSESSDNDTGPDGILGWHPETVCEKFKAGRTKDLMLQYNCHDSFTQKSLNQYVWERHLPFILDDTPLLALAIFTLLTTIGIYSKLSSKGWKRLSLVTALTIASGIEYLHIHKLGHWEISHNTSKFIFESMLHYLIVFILSLLAALLLCKIFNWIRVGFAADSGKTITNEIATIPNNHAVITQPEELDTAGFWDRFWARAIDLFIAYLLAIIISIFLPDVSYTSETTSIFIEFAIMWILMCIVIVVYDYLWVTLTGSSLGKMLFGIRIVNSNGEKPSNADSYLRAIGLTKDGLYLMFFFPYMQLISAIRLYLKLNRNEQAKWDGLGLKVMQSRIGSLHRTVAIIIGIACTLVLLILIQQSKSSLQQLIQQQFTQKSNYQGIPYQ